MATTPWSLNQHSAALRHQHLSARLDLRHPQLGITAIELNGTSLPSLRLHGVQHAHIHEAGSVHLADAYVRGSDLVAAYEIPAAQPLRVQVYWRMLENPAAGTIGPVLESQISVQTSDLQAQPKLVAETRFAATDWLHGFGDHATGVVLPADIGDSLSFAPNDGPGCFIFRLANCSVSYVEMIHPADHCRDELQRVDRDGLAVLRHDLFGASLEKGVILRGRLRGQFVQREKDTQIAAACYQAFLAEAPPLTT